MTDPTCRSRSRFGHCGRPADHSPPHAVPIGDGVVFGYERGGVSLGYGHLHGDTFEPDCSCNRKHEEGTDAQSLTPAPSGRDETVADGRALTAEQANEVWDILVEHAGANESDRAQFVFRQTRERCVEYRFWGALGFGGKFWTDRWRVTAYPEHMTPVRRQAIDITNAALAGLAAAHAALDAALGQRRRKPSWRPHSGSSRPVRARQDSEGGTQP